MQDEVDQVVVCHLAADIESINTMQVFLDSTFLFGISNLFECLVQLVVIAIVLSNGMCDFFPSMEPMLVGLPSFAHIYFFTQANVGQS